ncbi:Notchless protein-like 1, partial [Ophiophagus hannah]
MFEKTWLYIALIGEFWELKSTCLKGATVAKTLLYAMLAGEFWELKSAYLAVAMFEKTWLYIALIGEFWELKSTCLKGATVEKTLLYAMLAGEFWELKSRCLKGATSLSLLHTSTGHRHWVLSIAWSPDGRKLASGCKNGQMGMEPSTTVPRRLHTHLHYSGDHEDTGKPPSGLKGQMTSCLQGVSILPHHPHRDPDWPYLGGSLQVDHFALLGTSAFPPPPKKSSLALHV